MERWTVGNKAASVHTECAADEMHCRLDETGANEGPGRGGSVSRGAATPTLSHLRSSLLYRWSPNTLPSQTNIYIPQSIPHIYSAASLSSSAAFTVVSS